jgi:hypothetical protein
VDSKMQRGWSQRGKIKWRVINTDRIGLSGGTF